MIEQIDNYFKYHAPKDDQTSRYLSIRDKAKELDMNPRQRTDEIVVSWRS